MKNRIRIKQSARFFVSISKRFLFIPSLTLLLLSCTHDEIEKIKIPGLTSRVEVLRDQWGINHIYAKNQHDLFFTQGYCAARDRLFQFEIWRRQSTGTVAEILGPRELTRDIGTRLFMFHGDMKTEMNHYHPEGEEIITAFVEGVNAYIEEVINKPELLPIEFMMLNILPGYWTPEVVISRHQGLLGNINAELRTGRAVTRGGVGLVKGLSWFHPRDPILGLDSTINGELLFDDILELYNAFRRGLQFESSDIAESFNTPDAEDQISVREGQSDAIENDHWVSIGSNNWIVNGDLTESGYPMMANDPHRTITMPSLRYMVHLNAPGWNVIGGGEPEIPGVSIGHNEYGAWGLTVFSTDGEDLYVYDLNPENLNQYKYLDNWEEMEVITETFSVKDSNDIEVHLRYTRHGPVTFIDSTNYKAYAVRCAWLEAGGSPYLASLRIDQVKSWKEFRNACNYSHIPGENMIWADREGNIGWQAVGIAPIRRNFSGLVPVPGDGRYEWDGYLPIIDKPHLLNPEKGFFTTANQNVIPPDYGHWDAIGFSWSDPFRGDRINEVLGSGKKLTMVDMIALQTDYLSLPARQLVPMLKPILIDADLPYQAKEILLEWNCRLDTNSIAAGIYVAWENQIIRDAYEKFVPGQVRGLVSLQLYKILGWIREPDERFGPDPVKGRDTFLKKAFLSAVQRLEIRLGGNIEDWKYGQEEYKHIYIRHPLSDVVNDEWREKLNAGPAPRGGNSYTPGSTGGGYNQTGGASFRIIVDTGNWDNAMGTNTPGQSGNPTSPFYKNLFDSWAKDEFFPVCFSRAKIESVIAERKIITPRE